GADLGILVTRGRSMTKSFQLTDKSRDWINGIKNAYSARPLPSAKAFEDPAFKIM
ncbi:MAG: biotin carboxylase, partial [Pseudomonadota bacterium]|nr:biotin carboxylase [Pseudomonadota bacterium]